MKKWIKKWNVTERLKATEMGTVRFDLFRVLWHFSIDRHFPWVICFDPFFFLPLPLCYRSFASPTFFLLHPINWLPVHHHAPYSLLDGCQGAMSGTDERAFDLFFPLTPHPYLHPSLLSAQPFLFPLQPTLFSLIHLLFSSARLTL